MKMNKEGGGGTTSKNVREREERGERDRDG
jgi:hypothetical protein